MEEGQLRLVKNTKKKKYHKIAIGISLTLLLAAGIAFVVVYFSTEEIEVSGNNTYTQGEIVQAVQEQFYVDNTLVMTVENHIFDQTYLPFIESISMSIGDSHTLKIKVKEKLRAGVFEYMGKNVYFDSEGIALESRNYLFSGVPVVTGVEFNTLVLGQEIPVDGDYFDTIVSITKKITTYDLDISEIHFEEEDDITLISGKFEIYLGSSAYLDGKMSKIQEVLESVSEDHKKGTIDMHLYTDEKKIITYSR